jgi:hypothetical protein
MLPDDPENTIFKRLKRPRNDDADPQDGPADRRGALDGMMYMYAGVNETQINGTIVIH